MKKQKLPKNIEKKIERVFKKIYKMVEESSKYPEVKELKSGEFK